ncbi:MAG: Grx4 family monothiol glutaredoxin [Gammaproteobacteria bacterium]|nr:MAG: Grx4 family monothiol glutaredoxin [Gammaproteobacteria bacterium]
MNDNTLQRIDKIVKENPIVIFMKGDPKFPMCGYSARASEALKQTGIEYFAVNILIDADIFNTLPQYANWPTFPQIYINKELVGGCDIVVQMSESGDLKSQCEKATIKT